MLIVMSEDQNHLKTARADPVATAEGLCLFKDDWSDKAKALSLKRLTFMGHGVARRSGVRLYGSSSEAHAHFAGYSPQEMFAILKASLPPTVEELDFLGCDIGLGHGFGDSKKLSWLDELTCRIRLDPEMSSKIKVIRGPFVDDPGLEFSRLMIASPKPKEGLGYQAYLLKESEAEALKEINDRINHFNQEIDTLRAEEPRISEEMERLGTEMGLLSIEVEKLKGKLKTDATAAAQLATIEARLAANGAEMERHGARLASVHDVKARLAEAVAQKMALLASTKDRVRSNTEFITGCRDYLSTCFVARPVLAINEDQARDVVSRADAFWADAEVTAGAAATAAVGDDILSGEFWGGFEPTSFGHSAMKPKLISLDSEQDTETDPDCPVTKV